MIPTLIFLRSHKQKSNTLTIIVIIADLKQKRVNIQRRVFTHNTFGSTITGYLCRRNRFYHGKQTRKVRGRLFKISTKKVGVWGMGGNLKESA